MGAFSLLVLQRSVFIRIETGYLDALQNLQEPEGIKLPGWEKNLWNLFACSVAVPVTTSVYILFQLTKKIKKKIKRELLQLFAYTVKILIFLYIKFKSIYSELHMS